MAAPRTPEFLSFRRTFTLLILLVVLPSAGLSGFGVMAIVNERAAVEKRLEATWAARLSQVQGALLGAPLPAAQSFILIWPQLTGLVAAMIVIFAIAYVVFQRQEIRA